MDTHGLIQLATIAGGLAGVVTNAPVNRRHRVVFHQPQPGCFIGPFFRVIEPGLDVLAGGAGVIARRQPIDIDRFHRAPVPGVIGQAAVRIERDGEGFAMH